MHTQAFGCLHVHARGGGFRADFPVFGPGLVTSTPCIWYTVGAAGSAACLRDMLEKLVDSLMH